MSKVIYWAVKLDTDSRVSLLSAFPPIHPNVYADHMTIAFNPSSDINKLLSDMCGLKCTLKVVGHAHNGRGQAVVVECDDIQRYDGGIKHITISCANGTYPVYSNQLLNGSISMRTGPFLYGTVTKFTNDGWVCTKQKDE